VECDKRFPSITSSECHVISPDMAVFYELNRGEIPSVEEKLLVSLAFSLDEMRRITPCRLVGEFSTVHWNQTREKECRTMSTRFILQATFAWACLIYAATPASADLLVSFTNNNASISEAPGQSVTTTGSPSTTFNNIIFNWFTSGGTSVAFGNLYVFTSPYSGSAAGLSMSSYLYTTSTIVNNQYVFNASDTLQGGTKYYFYGDTSGTSYGVDTMALLNYVTPVIPVVTGTILLLRILPSTPFPTSIFS